MHHFSNEKMEYHRIHGPRGRLRLNYFPLADRVVLTVLVIVAAGSDYRSRRVPNWLTLAGALLGIGMNSFLGEAPGLLMSLKGAGLALLIYLPLYLLRGVGGGDLKLMAAIGALAGPMNWLGIFLLTAIFGGLIALVLVAYRHRFRQTLNNLRVLLASLSRGRAPFEGNPQLDVRTGLGLRLPHAVVIAAGTLTFLAGAAIL